MELKETCGGKQSTFSQRCHHLAPASHTEESHGFGTWLGFISVQTPSLPVPSCCSSMTLLHPLYASWAHCFTCSPLEQSSISFSPNKSHLLSFLTPMSAIIVCFWCYWNQQAWEDGGKIGGSGVHFPSKPVKYLTDLRSRANSQQYSSVYKDQRPKIEDIERSDVQNNTKYKLYLKKLN